MQIDKTILQQNLELLDKCSSISINGDVSDKLFIHEKGLANMSRGRLGTYIDMEFDFKGIFCTNNFLRIIKAMPGNELSFELIDDELKISGSKTNVRLKVLEVENGFSRFINTPLAFCTSKKYAKLPDNFLVGLETILPCALQDTKTAAILSNVAIISSQLIASDNYKIGRFSLTKKFPSNFLIDTYNIQSIIDFCPDQYFLDSDRIVFKRGDNYQLCAINLNTFPDFLPYIDRESGCVVELPDEVKECVNIATQFSDSNDKKMEFTLSKNKLGISCKTATGWVKKNVRISYDDNPIKFSMNLSVLNRMLSSVTNTIDISEEGNAIAHTENFDYCFPISIIRE